ncbi:putative RNA helicase [Tieghemostelium lacteum]|uniref:RNA helicase n=1 Tax=Tieghemostelium lacteum TaxID=361077 RepID=A0A151ZCK4_TIELA|nr:putative RNA helicase [Tieghemostelium lacteum]|eukprot:KYQ91669.1 putative RNA helicase [Tieghemostelium lacteum]
MSKRFFEENKPIFSIGLNKNNPIKKLKILNNDDNEDSNLEENNSKKKLSFIPFDNDSIQSSKIVNIVKNQQEPLKTDKQPQIEKTDNEENEDDDDDDEVDPLDAFMETVKEDDKNNNNRQQSKRDDIDDEDDEEKFYKHYQKQRVDTITTTTTTKDDEYIDEDDEDFYKDNESLSSTSKKRKIIEPLPPIDHSKIKYNSFEKYFYKEHDDISDLSQERVASLRQEFDINVSGNELINPVTSFAHFGFDDILIQCIQKQGYEVPTPIQKQTIPIVLSGRDLIGIAKTGSGKTASFIWPSIAHILDQPYLQHNDGPIALFLAPTRELAHQIYQEALKFVKYYKIKCSVLYGGVSKQIQCKELKAGCEIIVSTPGRLIDMIKLKATNLQRVTYLVLDEADRMFDMGFGQQVSSIVQQTRPDRQTLLFSATFKPAIEQLARQILSDPIKVTIGRVGAANQDIIQTVQVFREDSMKWQWLVSKLPEFVSQGSLIVFVSTKIAVEELSSNLSKHTNYLCQGLHGDKTQIERTLIIKDFRDSKFQILVATDVASRGLDIPFVRVVVNFDPARDIDVHTHRIGRTGRAGTIGSAYTLITPKDSHFAVDLLKSLEHSNQQIPQDLIDVAMKSNHYRKPNKTAGLGYSNNHNNYNNNNSNQHHHHSNKNNYNNRSHNK